MSYSTDSPECPHCRKVDRDWWDGISSAVGDGACWTANCGTCGNDYKLTLHTSYSFTTEKDDATANAPDAAKAGTG